MQTTINMGLIKWNESGDAYDHAQLAGNFQLIDEHDHTINKGKRLKGSSLENEAIDTAQLKDKSVTNAKLAGGITADKLQPGIINSLGDFKWWWGPYGTPIPSGGWVICAGQTLGPSQHEFPSGGNVTLPNLIGRTIFGSEPANLGIYGGVSAINLAHSHYVYAHTHSVPAHDHFVNLESGFGAATNLKISQDLSGNAWVHSDNESNAQHRHSINGNVFSSGPWESGAKDSSTDGQLGWVSIIPPYVGLLPLLKVKNS